MFIVVYYYRIPKDKTIDYFTIEKQAIEIYLESGCVGIEIYRDSEDPDRWMEINRFQSKEHYEKVSATLDEDPRISQLYEEFKELLGGAEYLPEKETYFQMI
ncbi:MAG: antibiotic biosynthesis monooxygenase [Candidatus Bathyarchaeota archaeon]|nr:antibiotic biosynthesis monooxygenase [Candidatus Bathyarchaeota archaeon]